MTVETDGISAIPTQRERAEKMWHLRRGFETALFIVLEILLFGLIFHRAVYDLYLDVFLGRKFVEAGWAGLRLLTPQGGLVTGWLWWAVAYGLSRAGGPWLVSLVAALLAAAGTGVLLAVMRRKVNVVLCGFVLLGAVVAARPYFVPGGQGPALLLLAALVALLMDAMRGGGRRFWFCVPLMLLWVNLDISWWIGVAVCAAFLLSLLFTAQERKAEKAAALAAAIAVTLVNPDFASAYAVLARLPFARLTPAAFVAPLGMKVASSVLLYSGIVASCLFVVFAGTSALAWLLVAAVLVLIPGVSVNSYPLAAVLAATTLSVLFLRAFSRFAGPAEGAAGGFMVNYAVPLLSASRDDEEAADDAGWLRLRLRFGLSAMLAAAGLLACLVILSVSVAGARVYRFGGGVDETKLPVRAMEFVRANHLSGKVITSPAWVGYVLTAAYPDVTVMADSRPLATDYDVATAIAWAFGMPPAAQAGDIAATVARSEIAFAIVPQKWARATDFIGKWVPVYWDDASAVFVPKVPANAALVAEHDQSLTYPPYFGFGLNKERAVSLIAVLEARLKEQGESAYARYELAMCYCLLDQRETAAMHLIVAVGIDPTIAVAYHVLGDIVRTAADPAIAKSVLNAFSVDPDFAPVALQLRGRPDSELNPSVAMMLYALAVRHDTSLAMAYLRLGELFLQKGDITRAIDCFDAARRADDRLPQLDRVAPGLRKQLDERIKMLTTPRPAPQPAPSTEAVVQEKPAESLPATPAPDAGAPR